MRVHSGPDVVESGLVLHLDAANSRSYPGSGTVWTDLSGNGNNATLVNSPEYNRALTQIEVSKNFQAIRGRYGL